MFQVPGIDSDKSGALLAAWQKGSLGSIEKSIRDKKELSLEELTALSTKFIESDTLEEKRKYFGLLDEISKYAAKSLSTTSPIWGNGVGDKDTPLAVDTMKLFSNVGMKSAYNFPTETTIVIEKAYLRPETKDAALKSFEFFSMKPQCSISEATASSFVEVIIDPSKPRAARQSLYKIISRLVKNDPKILEHGERLFKSLLEQMKPLDPISGMKDFVQFGFHPSDELVSIVIARLPETRLWALFQKMQASKVSVSDANIQALEKYLQSPTTAKDAVDSLCSISIYQEIPDEVRLALCSMIDKPEYSTLQTKIHETLSRGISPFTDEIVAFIAPEDKPLSPNSITTLSSRGVISERIVKHLTDSIWDIAKLQAKSDATTIVKGLANSASFSIYEAERSKIVSLMYHERCTEDIKSAYIDSLLAQERKGERLLEPETKFIADDLSKIEEELPTKLIPLVKDELLVKGNFFVGLLAPNAHKRELFLVEIGKFVERDDVEPIIRINSKKILKSRTTSLVSKSLDMQADIEDSEISSRIANLHSAMEANHHFNRKEITGLEELLARAKANITKADKGKVCAILSKVISHQNNITSLKPSTINILSDLIKDSDTDISLRYNACRSLNQLIEMHCKAAMVLEVADSMAVLVRVNGDPVKAVAIDGFQNFVKADILDILDELYDSIIQILPEITDATDLLDKAITGLYEMAHRGGAIGNESIEKLVAYSQNEDIKCSKNEKLSFLTIAYEAMNWNNIKAITSYAQSDKSQPPDLTTPKHLTKLLLKLESMNPEMQILVLRTVNLYPPSDEIIESLPKNLIENIIIQDVGEESESYLRHEACILMSNLLMAGYIPVKGFANIISENLSYDTPGEFLLLRTTIMTSDFIASDEMIYGLSDIVATYGDPDLVAVAIITLMTAIESRDKTASNLDFSQIAADIKSALELEDKRLFAPIDEALEILETKYGVKFVEAQISATTEAGAAIVEAIEPEKVSIQTAPRSRQELISELKTLNDSNDKIQSLIVGGELERRLDEINRFFEISKNWDKSQISQWGNTKGKKAPIEEIIAVADRANEIITDGHRLRDTQKIAALLLSNGENEANLAQMKTGEGKTTVIAVAAIIKALQGKKVDIITSSPILAIEGATNKEALYNMFGLKVDHNYMPDYHKGPKECYESDIVYGSSDTFQHDYLRHVYKKFNTRGDRDIRSCFAIVDEVDSMMLDEKDKIAKIASPSPGMEYLSPLLSMMWDKALQIRETSDAAKLKSQIELYGRSLLVEKIVTVPKHLEDFANYQMSNWADSAIRALSMSEEVDYVITNDSEGREVVAPVDFENTGMTQKNTAWQNGLHQFLQMKHGLEVKAETLTSSFISNMSFFKMYGANLCGLTGTLGSPESRALLAKIYKVDTFEIPTFQVSKLKLLPGISPDNEEKWLATISSRLHEEVDIRKGAALLICDSISSAKKIASRIEQDVIGKSLRLYTRSDEIEEGVTDYITNGDIIVATNLAGRGTDIKTSPELEKVGGMYECTTFLPRNQRIADQAQGRTARQGNEGSAQLIINKEITIKKYGGYASSKVEEFEGLRNRFERNSIARVEFTRIPKILAEDELQKEFAEFAEELNQIDGDKYKASSLEEKWGLWLKTHTKEDTEKFDEGSLRSEFESFKHKMRAEYSQIDNPVYLTRKAYDKMASGEYAGSYEYYEEAIAKDPEYGFIAAYNMGYAVIRENNRSSKHYDDRTPGRVATHLSNASISVQKTIDTNIKSLERSPEGSSTRAQLEAKLYILEAQKSSINQAQSAISGMTKDQRIDIASHSKVYELLPQGPPYDSVVMEFAQNGLHIFYHLGAKPAPRDNGGMIVGMVAAAVAAPFTGGASFSLLGTAFSAMATSAIARTAASIYDNKGRLDRAFKDVTSARSMREIALDGLSSVMYAGAIKGFKIGDLGKVTGVARHTRIMQQHAIKAGISVVVRGEKPVDALKREAINSATASAVNMTADIAQEKGLSTGFKAGMHGLTGAASSSLQGGSAEQGFVAGFTTEIVSGTETGQQFAAPIAATTSMAMGGSAEDMTRAAGIASTIVTYNHKLHKEGASAAEGEAEEEDESSELNVRALDERGIDTQEQKITQIREEARMLRDIANTTLEGKDQEFSLLAASNYEAQAQDLSMPQREFSDILDDVLRRNMVGMTPGVRVFGDLAGEVLSLTSDRVSRLVSSNYYGRAAKAATSAGATMFGRRIVSGAEQTFGQEAVQATGESLASAAITTAEFAHKHLAPGEQTLLKGAALTLAGYGAGRALSNLDYMRRIPLKSKWGRAEIIRGDNGRISGAKDAQVHHVYHQKLSRHPLFRESGMDVEITMNKKLLPTSEGTKYLHVGKKSVHQGRHVGKVELELKDNMKKVLETGKLEGYTQEQYQKAFEKLVMQEREALETGKRILNQAKDYRK